MTRSRLASLLVVALPWALGAQQKVDINRPATANVSVRLNGALSKVRVIGTDIDAVVLVGSLVANSRLEGGPMNSATPVSGLKFYIDAPDETAARANNLELRVPRGARVWIKAGSADIEVSGVTGSLDLNIIGGSVKVGGKPRELVIESMDGAVSFDGVADYARIKTATGDINLVSSGDDYSVTSISGNITVAATNDAGYQRARFESVTGTIVFAGNVARGGEARFETHSGAVDLRVARQANLEFDITTFTGGIENQLSPRRPTPGREGRGMELVTSSGNGGASVVVRSFKGNVKLTTR